MLLTLPKSHDGNPLSFPDEMRRSSINDDSARSGGPDLHIGFQAGTRRDRRHENLLTRPQPGLFYQVSRYFYTSLILDRGLADHGPMKLRYEHLPQHGGKETASAPRVKKRKSACIHPRFEALCVLPREQ